MVIALWETHSDALWFGKFKKKLQLYFFVLQIMLVFKCNMNLIISFAPAKVQRISNFVSITDDFFK